MLHKTLSLNLLSGLIGASLMGTTCHAEEQVFKSPKDKINYAIGAEVARNYKNQGLELNPDMVMKGMRDALSGGKLLVPEKELRAVLIAVQSEIRRKQSSSPKPVSAESKKTGEIAK